MSDDAKMWQDAHARAVAEIARLRSVCREAARTVGDQRAFMYPQSTGYARLTSVMRDLAKAGKEPTE